MVYREDSSRYPKATTFSIIARDPESGEMGVAVQSHWFSVGARVAWAEAGVGVVATQAMVKISYGPMGLKAMRSGASAPAALQKLLVEDAQREVRQVAMLDAQGQVATHTGKLTIADAGHVTGEQFSVQANMMANPTIWSAMAEAYRGTRGHLSERMMAAMEAAQAAGGDIRGQQSACMVVVKAKASAHPCEDRLIDLRIEDHPTPIQELRRLLNIHQAYELMDLGDQYVSKGEMDQAMEVYRRGANLAPHIAELPFWVAVTLADLGKLEDALPIFKEVFQKDPDLARLVPRLIPANILHISEDDLRQILKLNN